MGTTGAGHAGSSSPYGGGGSNGAGGYGYNRLGNSEKGSEKERNSSDAPNIAALLPAHLVYELLQAIKAYETHTGRKSSSSSTTRGNTHTQGGLTADSQSGMAANNSLNDSAVSILDVSGNIIEAKKGHLNRRLFEATRKHILNIFEDDFYPEYQESVQYFEVKDVAEKHVAKHRALQNSQMITSSMM